MSVRLTYKYTPIKLPEKQILSNLLDKARIWWDGCIMEWAEAVISGIHVDTGMSASSLMPLMDDAGGVGAGRLIAGARTRKGVTTIDGRWLASETKGPQTGAEYGEHAFIIDRGSVSNMILYFEYNIQIFQWARWEGAWNTGTMGEQAFDKEAATFRGISSVFSKAYQ